MKILIYKDGKSNASLKKYLDNNGIRYDTKVKEDSYDFIIKPPGVTLDDVPKLGFITSDIDFLYFLKRFFMIGVTGTNGKTTCVSLIHKMLKKRYKSILGGNIGIPLGDVLKENSAIYTLELSSFELENAKYIKPRIAVILNLNEAHLDHHKTFKNYMDAKFNITKHQDKEDYLIYNYDDVNVKMLAFKSKALKRSFSIINPNADAYYDGKNIYLYKKKLDLTLYSNLSTDIKDILASLLVANLTDISISDVKSVISNFKKDKYRMEYITNNIINDAKSTNIYSTIEALKNLSVVNLICGGYDRNNSLDDLLLIKEKVNCFYLYGANKKRVSEFLDKNDISYVICQNLKEATIKALSDDYPILYSPMAPSYDMYNSYIERGEEFERIIKEFKHLA